MKEVNEAIFALNPYRQNNPVLYCNEQGTCVPQIPKKAGLPFGNPAFTLWGVPQSPLKNFMLGVIILKERKVQLKMRATEKEKVRIENKAKKCGLSVSEYLRKRALGYSPKALLPESFYEFTEKIGVLYEALGTLNSTELQTEVLKLLDEIYEKVLIPDRKDGDD